MRVATVRKIVRTKQRLTIAARERWPAYASSDEDDNLSDKR